MVFISSCFSFKRLSNSDIRWFCKSSALYISSILFFLPLPLASVASIAPIAFDDTGVIPNLGGTGNAGDNKGCPCCCSRGCSRGCGFLNFPNSVIIFLITALLLLIIISDAFLL